MLNIALLSIGIALVIIFVFISFRLRILRDRIRRREGKIIELYREKTDKIPALVEIMRKHTAFDDIFIELIHLHKIAIISNVTSVYDLLESNDRIHREFLFLMKVSMKISGLHKDGNFLYVRDFIMFYESNITKEIRSLNLDIERYNALRSKKNLTIVGILFPFRERLQISI